MNFCPYVLHLLPNSGEAVNERSAHNAAASTKNRAVISEATNKGIIYIAKDNMISHVKYVWCLCFILFTFINIFMRRMMMVCCDQNMKVSVT
jgi:hypothetical protein